MNTNEHLNTVRNNGSYIAGSVHYSRRKFDKQFEIVARATDTFLNEHELNFGGEVVLAVAKNRNEALDLVRFFRKQVTA